MKPARGGKSRNGSNPKAPRQVASVSNISMSLQPCLDDLGGQQKFLSHQGQRKKETKSVFRQSPKLDNDFGLPGVYKDFHSTSSSKSESEAGSSRTIAVDVPRAISVGTTATVEESDHMRNNKHRKSLEKTVGKPNQKTKPRNATNARLPKLPGASSSHNVISNKKVLPEINKYERILMGSIDNLPPQRSSIIRIFLSSTFSDFRAERNALTRLAYPRLQAFCTAHDLDFQVMDLRWGITDDVTNDHSTESICLQEIKNCQRLSRGPNFVALLGDRYGYRPLIPTMEASKFEGILKLARENCPLHYGLLEEWYLLDNNSVPPCYILQPITSKLENYGDTNPENEELRVRDRQAWCQIQQDIKQLFIKCISLAVERASVDTKGLEINSVTENEIYEGLLNVSDADSSCLAFLRHFLGADGDVNEDRQLSRHIDVVNSDGKYEADLEAQCLRKELQTAKIPNKLSSNNIETYSVAWQPSGIDPQLHVSHHDYLEKLCNKFVTNVERLIKECKAKDDEEKIRECSHTINVNQRGQGQVVAEVQTANDGLLNKIGRSDMFIHHMTVKNILNEHQQIQQEADGKKTTVDKLRLQLNEEILHHLHFCKQTADSFIGRAKELKTLKEQLCSASRPFIVHAASGVGKTAFMAKVAMETGKWLQQPPVRIVRFLGTTPQSSKLSLMLRNVCQQICLAYGEPYIQSETRTLNKALQYFENLLWYMSTRYGNRRPLVVILDSLDQLDSSQKSQWFEWLPSKCPANTYLVVSLIAESKSDLTHALERFSEGHCFFQLEPMNCASLLELAQSFLNQHDRRLTPEQIKLLETKINLGANPLLLKLWLDDACTWRSYTDIQSLNLASAVEDTICILFKKFEKKYGKLLVEATLGYITLCKDGITEVELEDVLSCNDEVLNEVFQYHDPPVGGIVRIPSLLWTRMKYDLHGYVVERQAYSKEMLGWHHRQFQETANMRYGNKGLGQQRHRELANLFVAEEPVCRTIRLEQRNLTVPDANRMISVQPLTPRNRRKLISLPFHLVQAGDYISLGQHVIFNFHFLICCIQSNSAADIIREILTCIQLGDDHISGVSAVMKAFKFSLSLGFKDPRQFAIQMLGQLIPMAFTFPNLARLLQQANEYLSSTVPILRPLTGFFRTSSSCLQWYVEGPRTILAQSRDLDLALVTFSSDNPKTPLCQVVNLETGDILQSLPRNKEAGATSVTQAAFSYSGLHVYALCESNILVFASHSVDGCSKISVVRPPKQPGPSAGENYHIAISKCDRHLIMAGPNRLLMFEDKSQGEPDFKPRTAINLNGATGISNLLYVHNENVTISSHVIKGEKKKFGAVVLWEPWSKELRTRVPLPSTVAKGFLYQVSPGMGDLNILAGCENGQMFSVDMNAGAVLKAFGTINPNVDNLNILSSFDSSRGILAVGHKKGTNLVVWDVHRVTQVTTIETSSVVTSVRMAPGNQLVLGSARGSLEIYNISKSGTQLLESFVAHEAGVDSVCCRDEDEIVSCSHDNYLKSWNLEERLTVSSRGKLSKTNQSEESRKTLDKQVVDTYVITPDSKHLITGSSGGPVVMWDLKSGQYEATLLPDGGVSVLEALRGDDLLFAVTPSGALISWDINSQKDEVGLEKVTNIQIATSTPDNCLILVERSTSDSTNIIIFSMNTKKQLRKINVPASEIVQLHVTPNGQYLLLKSKKSGMHQNCQEVKVTLLDLSLEDSKEVILLVEPIYCISCARDNFLLLGGQGEVKIIEISKVVEGTSSVFATLKQDKFKMKPKIHNENYICCVAASLNETYIACGTDNGKIDVWKDALDEGGVVESAFHLKAHKSTIMTMLFTTTQCCHLVTGSKDHTLKLWDVSKQQLLRTVHLHAQVTQMTVSKDNNVVVVMTKEMKSSGISLWELLNTQ